MFLTELTEYSQMMYKLCKETLGASSVGYMKLGNIMICWGWSFYTGNGSSPYGVGTITFSGTFKTSTFPAMSLTALNAKQGSDPANIGEFTTFFPECVVGCSDVTNTKFTARWYKTAGNIDNGARAGMSYVAVGVWQ